MTNSIVKFLVLSLYILGYSKNHSTVFYHRTISYRMCINNYVATGSAGPLLTNQRWFCTVSTVCLLLYFEINTYYLLRTHVGYFVISNAILRDSAYLLHLASISLGVQSFVPESSCVIL